MLGVHKFRTRIQKWKPAAEIVVVCLAVATALVLRLPLLCNAESLMNSDSAFNALSVRHLLSGDAFFLYYPGQDYQGITEGLLGIFMTKLFGWSALAYSCASLLFYLGFVVAVYLLTREAFGSRAAIKAIFLSAILPGLMLRYSLIAVGGHMFVPLAGALLAWFLFRHVSTSRPTWLYAIGFLAGFSYYTYKLSIDVIAPVAVCLVYRSGLVPSLVRSVWSRNAAPSGSRIWLLRFLDVIIAAALLITAWAVFFDPFRIVIGSAKIGSGSMNHGLARAAALIAVRLIFSWPQLKPWFAARGRVLVFFLASLLLGLMPMIASFGLSLPDAQNKPIQIAKRDQRGDNFNLLRERALPALLGYAEPPAPARANSGYTVARASARFLGAVYLFVLVYVIGRVLRRDGKKLIFARRDGLSPEAVLLLFLATPVVAYVFSNYIFDLSSHRYLIPVFVALPPLIAFAAQQISGLVRRRFGIPAAGWALVLAVCTTTLVDNIWFYRSSGYISETGFRIVKQPVVARDVADYFRERGISRAYGTYWTCYLLTFLADEQIVVAPYKGINERTPPNYTRLVREDPNPAYVFAGINQNLREEFENDLDQRGIHWNSRAFPGSMLGWYVYHLETNAPARP